MKWKKIKGFPYQVSDQGAIYSEVEKKYLSTKNNSVRLQENGQSGSFVVSRLVAEAFLPNPDNLPFVEHINNDKSDNRVENLRWVKALHQGRPEVVNKLRDTVAKKNGLIHGISPDGTEYVFRSHREGQSMTGISKTSIGYAINENRTVKGWIFYREN